MAPMVTVFPPNSHEHAERMCELAAAATGLKASDFVVASTGVIGQELNIAAIEQGLPQAAAQLSKDGSDAAANAIMTTDTVKKELAVSCMVGGAGVGIAGIGHDALGLSVFQMVHGDIQRGRLHPVEGVHGGGGALSL